MSDHRLPNPCFLKPAIFGQAEPCVKTAGLAWNLASPPGRQPFSPQPWIRASPNLPGSANFDQISPLPPPAPHLLRPTDAQESRRQKRNLLAIKVGIPLWDKTKRKTRDLKLCFLVCVLLAFTACDFGKGTRLNHEYIALGHDGFVVLFKVPLFLGDAPIPVATFQIIFYV